MFRFGVPRILVIDNGTQIMGEKITKAMTDLQIKHIKAYVAYPQANGQVEVSNRTIMQSLKKRVEEIPWCWVDELPNILWAYRNTLRSATDISPFKMAYGVEVVSPVEVYLRSPRVKYFDPEGSYEGLHLYNTLIEETRDKAAARVQISNQKQLYISTKKSELSISSSTT